MQTVEVVNHRFTSARGNPVEVVTVRGVGSNGTFRGFGRAVRAFARVCGTVVEVDAGCTFTAPSAVSNAGF